MEKAKKIFKDLLDDMDTCEEMMDALRSMNSCGEISNEEYDYLMDKWDDLLEEFEG